MLKYSSGLRRCLASSINTAACILIAGLLVSGEGVQLRLDPALVVWGRGCPCQAGMRGAMLPGCGVPPHLLGPWGSSQQGWWLRIAGARHSIPSGVSVPEVPVPHGLRALGEPRAVGALGAFGWFAASRWH